MEDTPGTAVFISYRREDTGGQARALHDRLIQHFTTRRIFMDVDSIAPGDDFVDYLQQTVASSGAMLALIGNDWLAATADGTRRIDDPADFVRLEIASALAQGIPLIPILVERARMPRADDLPDDLRAMVRRHALEIENVRWNYDVGRLLSALERLLVDPTPAPAPVPAPEPPEPPTAAVPVEPATLVDAGPATATIPPPPAPDPATDTTPPPPPPPPPPPRPPRRWLLVGGVGLVVAALVAAVLVVVLGSDPKPQIRTAESLVVALATAKYVPAEIPARLSEPSSHLDTYDTVGLVGAVRADYPGPDDRGDVLFFDVFRTEADAKAWFLSDATPADYHSTGSFNPGGFDDPIRCVTVSNSGAFDDSTPTEARSICRLYRGLVGVYALTGKTTTAAGADNKLSEAIARAGVTRLKRLERVDTTSSPTTTLAPGQLYGNLLADGIAPGLTPSGMVNPKVSTLTYPADGIIGSAKLDFGGPDYTDYLLYFVFDSEAAAKAVYDLNLGIEGSTKNRDLAGPSGLVGSRCQTLSHPAGTDPTTDPAMGQTTCDLLQGNVWIRGGTSLTTDTQGGNLTSTYALLRAAVFNLESVAAGG